MGIILIFSENVDESSNEVIDWLIHYNYKVVRINAGTYIKFIEYDEVTDVFQLSVNDELFLSSDLQAIWYRKGEFYYPFFHEIKQSVSFSKKLDQYVTEEWKDLFDFFIDRQKKIKILGSYQNRSVNKLKVLDLAKQCGFLVPHTFITSKKSTVEKNFESHGFLIVKGIVDSPNINSEDILVNAYTERIDHDSIEKLPHEFFPSLFQKEIVKKFEIRSFMLSDCFYSMAIFSQGNPNTLTDFRKYDKHKPNRTVPFQLKRDTEQKCKKLAKKIAINSGSFDFIVSENEEIFFLEINPVGQFMMVSKPCNYPIEMDIANYLIA